MQCGVWVDHRRAILVKLEGDQATSETILSNVAPRTRRAGGSSGATASGMARARPGGRIGGPQLAVAEDRLDRKRDRALGRYYDRVAHALDEARHIYVMGPGEARSELVGRLESDSYLASRVIGSERTDKMTEPQIIARVREVFGQVPRRRRGAGPSPE